MRRQKRIKGKNYTDWRIREYTYAEKIRGGGRGKQHRKEIMKKREQKRGGEQF